MSIRGPWVWVHGVKWATDWQRVVGLAKGVGGGGGALPSCARNAVLLPARIWSDDPAGRMRLAFRARESFEAIPNCLAKGQTRTSNAL